VCARPARARRSESSPSGWDPRGGGARRLRRLHGTLTSTRAAPTGTRSARALATPPSQPQWMGELTLRHRWRRGSPLRLSGCSLAKPVDRGRGFGGALLAVPLARAPTERRYERERAGECERLRVSEWSGRSSERAVASDSERASRSERGASERARASGERARASGERASASGSERGASERGRAIGELASASDRARASERERAGSERARAGASGERASGSERSGS